MKWMLIVVVMGGEPVKTDLIFDSLRECLGEEDRIRGEIAEAYNLWREWAAANPQASQYPQSEEFMKGRIGLNNPATCIPHAALTE